MLTIYKYCEICKHKKWEMKAGTLCGVTNQKPKKIEQCAEAAEKLMSDPAYEVFDKNPYRNEIIKMIKKHEGIGKKKPADYLGNVYDFLTPPDFSWNSYTEKVGGSFIANRELTRKKVITAILGPASIGLTQCLISLAMGKPVYWNGLWLYLGLSGLILLMYRPKKILRMDAELITVRRKTFSYHDIFYAFFESVPVNRMSVNFLVFRLKDNSERRVRLEDIGYTPALLGPIVYTKMKMAEAAKVPSVR